MWPFFNVEEPLEGVRDIILSISSNYLEIQMHQIIEMTKGVAQPWVSNRMTQSRVSCWYIEKALSSVVVQAS